LRGVVEGTLTQNKLKGKHKGCVCACPESLSCIILLISWFLCLSLSFATFSEKIQGVIKGLCTALSTRKRIGAGNIDTICDFGRIRLFMCNILFTNLGLHDDNQSTMLRVRQRTICLLRLTADTTKDACAWHVRYSEAATNCARLSCRRSYLSSLENSRSA